MNTVANSLFENRYLVPLAVVVTVASVVFLTTPYPLLAILPGLAVIFILLVDRYPTLVFLAIIVTIPFGDFRHVEGPLEFIRIHWILGIFLALFIFFHCLPDKILWKRIYSNLWPPAICLLVIHLLASFFSPYPKTAFINVLLMASALAFLAVCIFFLPRPHIYRRILPAVLIWSISLNSGLAIIGYVTEFELFYVRGRAIGGAGNPNNMALMIIFTLPLFFHWLLHAPSLFKRLGASGLLGLNLMAIVITFSRGGALVLAVTLIGLLIEYRHRMRARHVGLWSMGMAIAAGLAFLIVPHDYWQRQRSLVEAEDIAMRRRASYITVALEAFQERPLLGHGPGSFRDIYADTDQAEYHAYYSDSASRPDRSELRRYAHNTYLEILAGNGIIGLLSFLALLWAALKNFTIARRRAVAVGDWDLAILTGSYRLSFVSLLFYFLFLSNPYHKYFLLALGLSSAALTLTSSKNDNFNRDQ